MFDVWCQQEQYSSVHFCLLEAFLVSKCSERNGRGAKEIKEERE